ncbi:MAG: MBL fold metallo-hydrolase [Sulfurospirillaceae bacterium]|nr:MBL fold metallo-hydrolase [Sulfurospirillaceae bacterium]MDD3463491.1 MBL fold metallo-hydrolase [Sulfurospirillaceae bacterium]
MDINSMAMGAYGTNCYIVSVDCKDFIIDPGVGATSWVLKNAKNPVAILNTHGHFDHVWSNAELKRSLNIPIYAPKADVFMLEDDIFSQGVPLSSADVQVDGDKSFSIDGVEIGFIHFPGHTPGCSAILIKDAFFSGDFVFKNSIGRVDFPYSDASAMKKSIKKFLDFKVNWRVYPGHGETTTVFEEQKNLPQWLRYI